MDSILLGKNEGVIESHSMIPESYWAQEMCGNIRVHPHRLLKAIEVSWKSVKVSFSGDSQDVEDARTLGQIKRKAGNKTGAKGRECEG